MKSQTSLVAQQTRLREWAEQIKECSNRPYGMTVAEWCLASGLTRANYYWRLRKVREVLLTVADTVPTFIVLKALGALPAMPDTTREENSSRVVAFINKNSYSIEITD